MLPSTYTMERRVMETENQSEGPQIVMQIWVDIEDGIKFTAYYDKDLIDHGSREELTILESVVLERIMSMGNFMESMHKIFGYEENTPA